MKAKIYSKIFAVLLSASVIASSMPAIGLIAEAETIAYASQGTGNESSSSSIPAFAMDAFNNAMTSYQGGTLTPLACYGEQVVAGYNFRFICRMNSNSQDDLNSLKFVTVYQNPQNVSTISEVSDFNIDDYDENYDIVFPDTPANGSMEVINGLQECELPSDAQTIFDRLYNGIVGVDIMPIAFLGKRTNDGTDYVYLTRRSPVVSNPDVFIDVLILHEDTDGAAGCTSIYSLLGTRTNYGENYEDDGKLTYEFKGNFKDTAGYAEGTITLHAEHNGTYKLYWADDNSVLEGYYPIKEMKLNSGESGSVSLGYHTVIPANATKVIAVTDSLSTSSAYSVFTIPTSKRLSSVSGNFLYSFSTYSDIHIDKGSLWYVNAENNFKEALKYSNDKNTDFIVVSGDCVTNDSGPDKEWVAYAKVLSESDYVNPIWESDGNHDLRQGVSSGLQSFIKGSGTDGSKSNKSYFSMFEPTTGDLFLFMSIELNKSPNEADVFSSEQLAWASQMISTYYNQCNIFVVQHSPIDRYGAGDRMSNPYYKGLLNQNNATTQQFKALLEQYPNVMFLSGHTHEDFTMDYNYSDENGTSANMIHTPSLAGSTMPNSSDDGLERNGGKGFNSQGYYVEVYENEIVFYGANITDKKIYPKYSYIMEGSRTSDSLLRNPAPDVPLTNKTVDITQELDKASYVLTQYYKFASYDSYQWLKKLYYMYRDVTTADESVITQFEDAVTALSNYTGTINYYALRDTYYFTNNKKWDNVYLYAWNNSSSNNGNWPGQTISKIGTNSNGEDIYRVKFNSVGEFKNIIFNAGSSSSQTVDIALHDYMYDGFYINGSSDGKYTVGNYDYSSGDDPDVPTIHDNMALVYYVTDEHGWSDTNTVFTYKDGVYKVGYDAKSGNTFSFSIYNKSTGKYYSIETHADLTCELGKIAKYTLKEMSNKGASISIYGLADKTHLDFEFNADTKEVTVICPQPEIQELKNNSTVSAESITLGETVTLNAAAEGGTAPYTFDYYFKKASQSVWTKKDVANTAASTTVKPGSAVPYNVKVVVTDTDGKTAEKIFDITVNPDANALTNKSTVSSSITLGNTIQINGSATGGTAPYTFEYYFKKLSQSAWTKKDVSNTTTSTTVKPGSAVPYSIKVVVTDAAGKKAESIFNVTVNQDANALKNTSSVSSTVTLGNTINITGKATGGTAPYTFEYYFKKASQSAWTKKNVSNTTTSTTVKPGSAVPYKIKVVVTDAAGKKAESIFDVTVNQEANALSNTSTVSSSITLGNTISIKGSAVGGTAPYTFEYYFKKATQSTWTKKNVSNTTTSTTVKPGSAVPYQIKVVVIDNTGKKAEKVFDVTVNSAAATLTNTSTVSSSITLGNTINITGQATGGTAPYTFEYYYKKASQSTWTQKNVSNTTTSTTIKPGSAVTYNVMIIVKDSTGNMATKTYDVTVN